MIRILRKLTISNTLRYTQYAMVRPFSSKDDDVSVHDPIDDEPQTSTDSTTFAHKRSFNPRYSNAESREILSDMLNSLPSDSHEITVKTLLEFYEKIQGNFLITHSEIKHKKFAILRAATEKWLTDISTKSVRQIFITLLPSKPVMSDKLMKVIVAEMIRRAPHLPFDQILFCDFVIRKYYSQTELNENLHILQLKLQTIFLSKIEDELDDESNDFKKTMKILAYCENNNEIVPAKILNKLTTLLLMADDDDEFTVTQISSVFIFLANFRELNPHVEKLFEKMVLLWCQSPATPKEIQTLFKVLAAKSDTIDTGRFQNTNFIQSCVDVVIQQKDIKLSFGIQNSFNKIGITNVELIEHLSEYFNSKDDLRKMTVADYIIIVRACDGAGYKPKNWDSHIVQALKTFKFSIYLSGLGGFDWAKFALTLNKLGCSDTRLIKNILKSKHLQKQKCYDERKLKQLKDILDHEVAYSVLSDDFESEMTLSSSEESTDDELTFYDDLKSMFGADKIWTNLQISDGLEIPYVLKMDLKSGDFLPLTERPSIQSHRTDELLIGIIAITDENGKLNEGIVTRDAKKQSYRLKENGVSSIIIERNRWSSLKSYEKSVLFYTKVTKMMEIHRKQNLEKLINT